MIWDFSEVINPNKPLDVTVSQLSQLHMISVNDLTFFLADFTNFTNISHFHRLLRTNCVIENRFAVKHGPKSCNHNSIWQITHHSEC